MIRFVCCLVLVTVALTAWADAPSPVWDLSDPAVLAAVRANDAEVSMADGPDESQCLQATFGTTNRWPTLTLNLPSEQDWSRATYLSVQARNDTNVPVTIGFDVRDAEGKTFEPVRRLPVGKWREFVVPISQMAAGDIGGGWCKDAIDVTRVVGMTMLCYSPVQPWTVRFAQIKLVRAETLLAPKLTANSSRDGVVLCWNPVPGAQCYEIFRRTCGRRKKRLVRFPLTQFVDTSVTPRERYIYQVRALDRLGEPGEMSKSARSEIDPRGPRALPPVDVYGGRADVPLRATGFFRVEKVDGRWTFVDPDGHPFFSTGMCVVGLGDSYTRVSKREKLFEDILPEREDARFHAAWSPPYGYAAYGLDATGIVVSRYVRGLLLRDGDHWFDTWKERTLSRLEDWHINTIGAWGDARLIAEHRLPYTAFAGAWGDCPEIPGASVPDVYDPAFETNVNESASRAADNKHDPWLIGWFTANEMGWYGDWENGNNLVALIQLAPAILPAKRGWVDFLKRRYEKVEKLNAAWGTDFGSFTALLSWREKLPGTTGARKDAGDFLYAFAERYFRITSEAIRRYDPNHMILGARHCQSSSMEVLRANAKHTDVVSVTLYGASPKKEVEKDVMVADKPWLAGEFHFIALDSGLPVRPGQHPFPDQAARGDAYQDYVSDALSLPNFVGLHWFEYIDEPATGRFDHGEDGGEAFNIGWVNVEDEPYEDFVQRAKLINANVNLLWSRNCPAK